MAYTSQCLSLMWLYPNGICLSLTGPEGAGGSVVVRALCYKPEGRTVVIWLWDVKDPTLSRQSAQMAVRLSALRTRRTLLRIKYSVPLIRQTAGHFHEDSPTGLNSGKIKTCHRKKSKGTMLSVNWVGKPRVRLLKRTGMQTLWLRSSESYRVVWYIVFNASAEHPASIFMLTVLSIVSEKKQSLTKRATERIYTSMEKLKSHAEFHYNLPLFVYLNCLFWTTMDRYPVWRWDRIPQP
jgi:hypothetical protein